jgi:hypothetical protein
MKSYLPLYLQLFLIFSHKSKHYSSNTDQADEIQSLMNKLLCLDTYANLLFDNQLFNTLQKPKIRGTVFKTLKSLRSLKVDLFEVDKFDEIIKKELKELFKRLKGLSSLKIIAPRESSPTSLKFLISL